MSSLILIEIDYQFVKSQLAMQWRFLAGVSLDVGMQFKHYKRKFKNSLEPVFVMLHYKRSQLDKPDWYRLVNKTMNSVLNNPTEFLGSDLPEKQLMTDVVHELFVQFVENKSGVGLKTIIETLKKLSA